MNEGILIDVFQEDNWKADLDNQDKTCNSIDGNTPTVLSYHVASVISEKNIYAFLRGKTQYFILRGLRSNSDVI